MGPKHAAQEVPRLMANMLSLFSAALVPASAMQGSGVPTLPALLHSGSIMFLPLVLLGKVEEAKSWQLPTRKTPVCMEAVLNKSHRSMEAEADPFTSTPRLEDPCLPSALHLEIFTPVHFAQQSLSSQYSVVALCTQPRVPSEARGQQRIRPVASCFSILQSLLNCSAFNNPDSCLVPHFQT